MVYETLKDNSEKELEVYIATDSQQEGKKTQFGTVVVIKMGNKGCRVFVSREKMYRIGKPIDKRSGFDSEDYAALRRRLMTEATFVIDTANKILPVVEQFELDHLMETGEEKSVYFMTEIDANTDGNPKHISNRYAKEMLGYVKAAGFPCQCKPNSVMASNAADIYAKS